MKIILSPTKKMRFDEDSSFSCTKPKYLSEAQTLLEWLKNKSHDELKKLWGTSDKITALNERRLHEMDLQRNLTPAVLAYDGIAFHYMAPNVFEEEHFDYIQGKLRILSGFYGVLRPLDGVVPYRLEMQSKVQINGMKDLYAYWGNTLYRELEEEDTILNLASKEYSKCIEPYLSKKNRFITCIFGERKGDKVIQKSVYAKMARGDMVRFMAEQKIQEIEEIIKYNRMGYSFAKAFSTDLELVFLKREKST